MKQGKWGYSAELRALPLVRPPPAVSSLLARFAKRLGLPDAKN
jgi:hypothetical protein